MLMPVRELTFLDQADASKVETTLLIHPLL